MPDHFVRASLVRREGLFGGVFNVREARAEPRTTGGQPRRLGEGRLLSWRWLSRAEADRLLEARIFTLEAMGYELIDAHVASRGTWDWLRELVRRGLPQAEGERDDEAARARQALHDALCRLGLRTHEVIEGIADVLGVHPTRLTTPDPETIASVDREHIGALLPFLLEHDDAELRTIGERWLTSPTTAFELGRDVLVRWLERDGPASRVLAPRLPRDGLSLLGPDELARLASTSESARVRQNARVWVSRLGSV
jgi:hypothetical protein